MKIILTILILVGIISVSILSDSLVYGQEEEERETDFDGIQEMNLTLGKPIYVEEFILPHQSQDNKTNLANSKYSFSGNGILNNMEISATGNGIIIPREDNTSSIIGKALFMSMKNGSASYSFEEIAYKNDNSSHHLGAAFFDANATGNLEFLKSIVGIYKVHLNEKGIFAMWQLK
ncbi:MAG: hypothetical protein ACPKPY_12460 [Nitrososphaeraceae archaeon]